MNVSCTSCSARYAIPDEKVRGKKVKITCKHCSTGIIVDGTKLDSPGDAAVAAAAPPPAATPAPAPASPEPAPPAVEPTKLEPAQTELTFDIAHPDDRQETLPLGALADKYVAGTLTDEAFVWREGMPDWKAPLDIPEVAAAVASRGGKKPSPSLAAADDEEEETHIQESPFEGFPEDGAGKWREPAKEAPSNPAAAFDLRSPSALPFEEPEPEEKSSPVAAAAVGPKPAIAPSPPTAAAPATATAGVVKPAARRSAARGGGDLFGDLAAAGSEDDESLGTDAKDPAPKLTGQRNESSVLFSLDALTKQEQQPAVKKAAPKQDDAALLMGLDSSPSSLANVGSSFGSAFAAPDFTAPVAPASAARAADALGGAPLEGKKSRSGVWLALVAVLVLGGGAAAVVASGKLASSPQETPSAPVAATPAETTPTAETSAPAPADAAPAAAPSGAAPNEAAAPATAGGAPPTAAAPTGGGPATPAVAAPSKPTEAAKPAEKPAEKPVEKEPEVSAAAPFDTAAAKAALGSAAANAGSCKTPDGPTGSGKVSVTFMPSGRATNTQVSGDLAGTAVGGCVARLFRSAKVPAFSGDAVTVTKSFSVQ